MSPDMRSGQMTPAYFLEECGEYLREHDKHRVNSFDKTKYSPPEKLPVWARLQLSSMIPETYFWDLDRKLPRKACEAKIRGFLRDGDVIWISFTMEWTGFNGNVDAFPYLWPAVKNWGNSVKYPEDDGPLYWPGGFGEPRDDRSYRRCDLPGSHHDHHVPFPYGNCREKGSWTWESRYGK